MEFIQEKDNFVIIDTDCGGDDAMAIMLALSKPELQIIAITCCSGNTGVDNVCKNVMKVLTVCNRKEIPIYRGSCGPLIKTSNGEVQYDAIHGSDGLGDLEDEFSTGGLTEEKDAAAVALVQLAKQYPGKITVIALAPLTNIALAHRLDSQFTKYLRKLVCMGGNYKGIGNITETAEHNFYYDSNSAHIVLTEAQCPVVLVPWETTMDYGIDWSDFDELIETNSKKGRFLKRIITPLVEFCRKTECHKFYDCDFLAMAAALYPESIKETIISFMVVECVGEKTKGLSICLREPVINSATKNKVEIVVHFDSSLLSQLRIQMLKDT